MDRIHAVMPEQTGHSTDLMAVLPVLFTVLFESLHVLAYGRTARVRGEHLQCCVEPLLVNLLRVVGGQFFAVDRKCHR